MKKAGWKSILIGLAASALMLAGCAQAPEETETQEVSLKEVRTETEEAQEAGNEGEAEKPNPYRIYTRKLCRKSSLFPR